MYLSGREAAALTRCLDGLSDDAIVKLSRTDSLSNELPWDDSVGWLRVRVVDGDYMADDVIGDTGSVSGWAR